MKRRILWLGLSCLMATAMLLTSCTTTPTTTVTTTATTAVTTTVTTTTTSSAVTTTSTTASNEPQYGGTMTMLSDGVVGTWDPIGPSANQLCWFGAESLVLGDYYLPKATWDYSSLYVPTKYETPFLAESWEIVDSQTIVVNLRHGVYFQNKAPVNGREFVASDVKWFYDAFYASATTAKGVVSQFLGSNSIVVVDKYTVKFNLLKPATTDSIFAIVLGPQMGCNWPREVIDVYGVNGYKDWRNSVSTGPWILKDYVDGSGMFMARNVNYWQYDQLHPENRLPYMDNVRVLFILDAATRMAALRTHKADWQTSISWDQAESLQKTNPEMKSGIFLGNPGLVAMNTKKAPFTDVRVRQALNMAIDYEGIVKDYYHGNAINAYKTWPFMMSWTDSAINVNDWPDVVKDMFTYNPAKAKQLLADAGYPNGFDTKIEYLGVSVAHSEGMAIIAKYLAAVNVRVSLVPLELGAFSAKKYAHTYDQMLPWEWGGVQTFEQDPTTALAYTYNYPIAYNFADWQDTYFDTEFPKAIAIADATARIAKLQELAKYVMTQAPYILPPAPYWYTFWTPWIRASHPDGYWGNTPAKFQCYDSLTCHFWIDQALKESIVGK